MRRAILLLSTLLLACKMDEGSQSDRSPVPRYRTYASVEDVGGKDRIQLIYIERLDVDWEDGTGWDFHALIWQKRSDTQWQEFRRISQDDLEQNIENERWNDQIHSFDATDASAIVRVGEGDEPKGSGGVAYFYSWRRWDLGENKEVEYFYECDLDELFEPFDPNRNGEQAEDGDAADAQE